MIFNNSLTHSLKMVCLTLALLLSTNTTWAKDQLPVQMLKQVSQHMLNELKRNQAQLSRNDQVFIQRIVNRILLPHIAVNIMAQSVVGRYHWLNASAKQRQHFVQEFVTLVSRTYSTALSSYQNQKIQFLPMRSKISQRPRQRQRILVNSIISHPKGPSIPVSYRLIFLNKQWKIYDFSVDGVSLVQSYQSQFTQKLNQSGLSGLIQQLIQHNKNTS